MQIQPVTNQPNFKGKLVFVNELSNKPKKCVSKVQNDIQKLVKPKDYNLFIQQDYSKGEMSIIADYPFPLKPHQKELLFVRAQTNIPITSKASKYLDAAKKTIEQFDDNVRKQEQKTWEQEQKRQKKQDLVDTIESVFLAPVFLTEELLREINPKWANKFEKILQNIGL